MSAIDDLYQDIILDHYNAPRHRAAALDPHDAHVHADNPLCGDEIDLRLRVDRVVRGGDGNGDDGHGRVDAVVFDGEGCAISVASASAMTEVVIGRPVDDAVALAEDFRRMLHGDEPARRDDLGDAVAFEGVARFPVRVKCALLAWAALRDAIADATTADTTPSHGDRTDREATP